MSTNLNVTEKSYPWTQENPVPVVEGDARSFNVNCAYATLITSSSLANSLYLNGQPVSGLSGSPSVTGLDNNVTTSLLAASLPPGDTYTLHITATVDGEVRCAAMIPIHIIKKGKAF